MFYFCSPRKELSSPMKLTTTQEQRPRKSWLSGNCSASLNPHQESNQNPCFPKISAPNNRWEPTLQLLYKYRVLLEMFKATDTNCAMFFNCKEKITFKKLKPVVQRMLRKNFYETHLAQFEKLFPGTFHDRRKWGIMDRPQLWSSFPMWNIKKNPGHFQLKYWKKVHDEHEKFLETLETLMSVTRKVLKRWHPEFDYEKRYWNVWFV